MKGSRGELGEQEAVGRLELLLSISRALASAVDRYEPAVEALVETCVPEFCDLCAVEVISEEGSPTTLAYRAARHGRLQAPARWEPIGRRFALARTPLLGWEGAPEDPELGALRKELGAGSVIVAPIVAGGITTGWLVFANGPERRGFRQSALRVGAELGARVGTTIQRVLLHRSAVEAADSQARTARLLRRLAAASANLAGADSREEVLRTACIEACMVLDADAATASWVAADGTEMSVAAGVVDLDGQAALAASLEGRSAGRSGWVAQPLPCTDRDARAGLAVRAQLTDESVAVLGSLAALVPVAYERAITTDAAARQEQRLQAVLDASPVALLTAAGDGTVVGANPAAAELFGWDPRHPGRFPDPIAPAMLAAIEAASAGSRVEGMAVTDGELDLAVSAGRLAAGGDSEAVILAAADVSHARAAQRALLQAQRLEAMGQVAGGITHDFNNLLTVVLGYTTMLHAEVATDTGREMLARIDRAANQASQLTQRLLGLTRRPVADTDTVDLAGSVRDLGPVLERVVGAGVELTLEVPEAPVHVLGDASEVEQVVINLAINAGDAMEGSGRLVVRVDALDVEASSATARLVGPGRFGRLTVGDDGPGMAPDVRARCVEPFFTTKERGRGSGLGLSTVYAMATERGGHLDIHSSPGAGTTVEVLLPAAAAAVAGEGARPGELPTIPPGLRVLLVEDDPDLRDMADRALSAAGAVVVAAGSAEAALDVAPAHLDALVTDVVLPGASGADLADRLWAGHPGLPVLYLTGYAARDVDRLASPCAAVLRKPHRPQDLVARLAQLLARER